MINQQKLAAMRQGGKKLAHIRETLGDAVKVGLTPLDIESLAEELIAKSGGEAAFKKVPKYHHATCINVNDVVVHGIPTTIPFKDGDIVSIDVGLFYKGYYTDTAISVVAGKATPEQKKFLAAGIKALDLGIKQARAGNRVKDISKAIEDYINKQGYRIIPELTGHGIGRELHEAPYIPNYVEPREPSMVLKVGQTIAIEPMHTTGNPRIVMDNDGWTIRIRDGSPSSLFEHTLMITDKDPIILT